MLLLRKYQLEIIFLYFALMIILWTSFFIIKRLGADPHDYEWHIGAPLLLIYFICLWRIREKIKQQDHRALTGETLLYWIAFGTLLFLTYATPLAAKDYWPLEALFIMFTIFLADSYWDFRKLKFSHR